MTFMNTCSRVAHRIETNRNRRAKIASDRPSDSTISKNVHAYNPHGLNHRIYVHEICIRVLENRAENDRRRAHLSGSPLISVLFRVMAGAL